MFTPFCKDMHAVTVRKKNWYKYNRRMIMMSFIKQGEEHRNYTVVDIKEHLKISSLLNNALFDLECGFIIWSFF